jgi:hypothetical protein
MVRQDPTFAPPPGLPARLSIIDTTTSISKLPTKFLMKPHIAGMEFLPTLPAWSFLIESPTTGARALFDLGVPPDWQVSDGEDTGKGGFAPAAASRPLDNGWEVNAEKGVAETLEHDGVDRGSVGSVIWR